jgi:transcriptional regulator with XRE-family HTH domain
MEVARRNKNFTQHQLAKLARVDQAFVSMLERGVAEPTADQRLRFAAALEIDPAILTDEVPITAVDVAS